jgi:hypothetical protein
MALTEDTSAFHFGPNDAKSPRGYPPAFSHMEAHSKSAYPFSWPIGAEALPSRRVNRKRKRRDFMPLCLGVRGSSRMAKNTELSRESEGREERGLSPKISRLTT